LAESLATPDNAKAASLMERNTREIFRKDTGLQRPEPVLFRVFDKVL
jgi:hypothetical protein